MATDSPCRLFVYLARQVPVAVVLRRGPSDWVRLSRWDLTDDTFEQGQWMRARVYERRCDLSPDGNLFVTFVRGTPRERLPYRDSWVAVSRPPWFTALAHWFVGGTYSVGGYFPEPNKLWLGFEPTSPDQGALPPWLSATTGRAGYIERSNDWPDRTVWNNRLIRDGWMRIPDAAPETWHRRHPERSLLLRMVLCSTMDFTAYGGRFQIDYEVFDESGLVSAIGRADWADWDQRGRLIVARGGKLFNWRVTGEEEIADFNDQVPDPAPAPPEALEWPLPGPA